MCKNRIGQHQTAASISKSFKPPLRHPPLFHLFVRKSRHDASSHAPESFRSPPPDILAHQCQHYAPNILLAKYKVPQPNALRLSHFATIWLNFFASAFLSLFLSMAYATKYLTMMNISEYLHPPTNISILLYFICKTNIFPWYITTKQKRCYLTLKGRKNASYIGIKKTCSRGAENEMVYIISS